MKKLLSLLLVLAMMLSMFVACKPTPQNPDDDKVTYDLDGAAAYVEGLYKEELSVTAVDFTVVSQVMIGGVKYEITWSVDSDKVTVGEPANGVVTIGVDEKSSEEVSYKLTATIKAGDGTTKAVTFKLTVPKYNVNSHEDYMNAKADDMLTIEGIVVAINSKKAGNKYNHLFLADANVKGGYYCYSVTEDPATLGVKVGMTVAVTGPMTPYSGMQEIKGGQVAIIDETIKTVEPLDITDAFAAGSDLGAYVGLPVVIKGVEIGAQDLEKDTSQYLYFAIGEKQGYVRTYVTDFPAGMVTEADKATIDADHKAHFGYKADAAGILILYNGAPYLIPMSATPFTNYEEVTKTPAEKVDAELDGVKLDASFSSDTVVDLLLKGQYYDDVTLTWATDDTTGAAVIADGKLTIKVPDAELPVKITVTATCGDVTKSKEITIKLSKTITPIKDIVAIGSAKEHDTYTDEKYIMGGIIVEIQKEEYGNMIITDESGASILIYGTYIEGKKYGEFEGAKPVVGDYIVVVGKVGQYKGTAQMKNADLVSFAKASSLKDAVDAGAAKDHDTYTENKFLVTGEITEIASDKYGNMYIKDADGNTIYIYGTYDQAGVRFDKLATQPKVGDTITVLGVAGKYKETVQLKNVTLVALTAKTTEGGDNTGNEGGNEGGNTPSVPEGMMSIPEVLAAAEGTPVVVQGIVTEFYYEWSDQYNNCSVYIKDEAGNKLLAFRLATKVAIGDKITITGTATNYNGTNQIAEGCTAVIESSGNDVGGNTGSTTPVNGTTYTFANYAKGEQYAENEEHKLDDNVKVITNGAHFTTQIRLYDSAPNDYNPNGLNGTATFITTSAVKGLSINAGNKAAELQVYGSTDGTNWTLITTLNTAESYADFTVELGTSAYTYIKLDAVGAQIRVASVTIELA